MDDVISVVLDTSGETDICRGMKENLVALRAEYIQSCDDAAKHAVLIADALLCQSGHAVAGLMPLDDLVEILFSWYEVSECRVINTLMQCLNDRRYCREVHICNPHRDLVKALLDLSARNRNSLNGCCVFSGTVQNRCKIVFHNKAPFCADAAADAGVKCMVVQDALPRLYRIRSLGIRSFHMFRSRNLELNEMIVKQLHY